MDQATPATITAVRIAPAHEGIAELIVVLTHSNGGRSEVALDRYAAEALLSDSRSHDPDALIGLPWDRVQKALSASWNRFQAPQQAATHPKGRHSSCTIS